MLTSARSLALTAAIVAAAVVFPATASAEPPVECSRTDPFSGVCLLWVSSPGGDSGEGGTLEQVRRGVGGDSAAPDLCSYQIAAPQPAASHLVWAGRTPDDGSVYLQVCPRPDGYGSAYRTELVFIPTGTAPPSGPPVDPRLLAQEAMGSLVMRAPEIRMAPPPGSSSGLVGLPVWMWTERGEQVTGPTEASASAGGVTVTAVGQVSRIVWDMGDGTSVICGAGTPYRPGATGESPDCGHVYARASSRHAPSGGPWPVTATSTWTVTWSGGGLSGTEALELSASAALFVGELHVLNQAGER